MSEFTITTVSYQLLDFDRNNPRYSRREPTTDVDIVALILEHASSRRSIESYADPTQSQLHPWIVIASEDNPQRYTVIDGNIRLAAVSVSRNQELRDAVNSRTLPPFVDDDCAITVALFDSRSDAWLHTLRHGGTRAMTQWSHDQWAYLVDILNPLGISYADIAENSAIQITALASAHEAREAFDQLNTVHDNRWSHLSSSITLARPIAHHAVREVIGLPDKIPNEPVRNPLPQDDEHQRAQRELMDWIYHATHDEPKHRFNLEIGQNAQIHRLYESPELLADFRTRGHWFYTVQSFIDSYENKPSIKQAIDSVARLKYEADQAFNEARSKLKFTDAEYRLIMIANVTYSIDQYGDSHYVVDLASRFPEHHRPIADFIQKRLSAVEPSCMVRFW